MDTLQRLIMFQSCVAQMNLDPMGPHGPIHWMKVYRNCQELDKWIYNAPSAERDWFYWCFSMLHDCCRRDENDDPLHGARAAMLVPSDDNSDFNKRLRDAVMSHSNSQLTSDFMVGVCWDADRLELPRVGIKPDPEYMSTKPGQEFAKMEAGPPAGFDPKTDDPRLTQ